MLLTPITTESGSVAVTSVLAALASTLIAKQFYLLAVSTNAWIRQGTSKLVTCVTKANLATGDTITITLPGGAVTYQFDLTGSDALKGHTKVDVSGNTTAAQVAATLRTALLATQTLLEVTDNSNGTLTVVAPDAPMTIDEHVANAGFTVTAAIMTAAAAAGSMFVPSGLSVALNGSNGPQVGVIRDSADGRASLTRCSRF